MCQLLGLNSLKPVSPHVSLGGFLLRGGATDVHVDGWGLAWYERGRSRRVVSERAAGFCHLAWRYSLPQFSANNVIAHVRKATFGAISEKNCHPFVRSLWGVDWTFAHNGDLPGLQATKGLQHVPYGETDSELAFCHLFESLQNRFGSLRPSLEVLHDHVAMFAAGISRYGNFNFLLSDGDVLLAHCSSDLAWTQRRAPFPSVELLDGGNTVDFSTLNDLDDRMVVIATKPLTRGESWTSMNQGEVLLFQQGRLLFRSLPLRAAA